MIQIQLQYFSWDFGDTDRLVNQLLSEMYHKAINDFYFVLHFLSIRKEKQQQNI